MASRRTQYVFTSLLVAMAAGGYGLYMATAQSAPPDLSQTPMNITNVIPPAFIMGVDNSGSMTTDETLFRTDNGVGYFSNGSFFDAGGVPRESGTAISKAMDANNYADYYGALRSPEFNRGYFNPESVYTPWLNVAADGTITPDANAPITAAPEDPRGAGVAASPFTTFDFTTYRQVTETWLNGKVMPAGTRYNRDKACNGKVSGPSTWVTLGSDFTFTSNCSTEFLYYPARVYLSLGAAPPPGFDVSKRVTVKGAGPAGADLYRYDYLAANFTTGGAEAVQNFANWWTYYGNRNRAMIAGMTNSLAGVTAMRVGYFKINPDSRASAGESTGSIASRSDVTMRDMSSAAEKSALFTSMRALNSSGSTPTRSATAFMVDQFTRTDSGAPVKLQCQKNAGMLFTDGFTNDSSNARYGLTIGDQDGSVSAPYVPGAPYTGGVSSSNTIADIAMYGYKTILRTDGIFATPGKVPVPKACSGPVALIPPGTDCNPNLHMNFYGVTLGARGDIYEVNAAATADPYANAPSWGAGGTTNLQPSNVDDIWHAGLNSRGEFINAQSATDITAAMRRILAAVNDGATPSGTIGVTGARIGAGSLSLQPRYESTNNGIDWYGQLTAETVASNPLTGDVSFTTAWEASAKLDAQGEAARTIRFGTTTNSLVPTVRNFTAGNLSFSSLCSGSLAVSLWCNAASIQALDGGTMNLARTVAYLRGSRADEGALRIRTGILGDIINSSPVLASATDDYGYRALGGTLATSYNTFLASKKAANRPLALVGANDGMLHVFDGRAVAPGGNELFAYVPATSVDHMGNLVFPYVPADKNDQKFKHTYFVDGPIAISDAFIGGAWKTIAVGTSGAGGRSVFALDITNPASITVLWEVNNLITGNIGVRNNIGHVLGRPVVVPVKSSAGVVTWKVIFGNGYNSAGQQARLFVVDAATGATTTIAAVEATPPAYNGLGNISVIDARTFDATNTVVSGRDGYSDTVYAADQNGAVWKFDLLSNSVALSGQPLFIARDATNVRQPITGGLTTAAGPSGGVMVYFGTGSFSFTGDPNITSQQTIYGIFDNGASVTGRGALLQQTYGAAANGFRTTSNNPFSASKQGWFLDLPLTERFIGNPRVESGIVFFPTYEANASGATDCSVGGVNWLYGLSALNGGAAFNGVRMGSPTGTQGAAGTGAVSLVTGGSAPVKDVGVFTSPRLSPLGSSATQADIDAALAAQCSMVVRVAGAPPLYLPRPCGRQSWRQVR